MTPGTCLYVDGDAHTPASAMVAAFEHYVASGDTTAPTFLTAFHGMTADQFLAAMPDELLRDFRQMLDGLSWRARGELLHRDTDRTQTPAQQSPEALAA